MRTFREPDILVLGGGPAGTAAAILLAHAGARVTLVERERTPRHKVCGEFLSTEALHFLSHLGINPAAHGGPVIQTVRLCSDRNVTTSPLPFTAASLTRRCLDTVLLDAAEAAGAHVSRGLAVESLAFEDGRWHATLSSGETLQAPNAILATGKHDLRGFPRPGGMQSDLVALKMYWNLAPEQAEALHGSVELLLHPEGYTGLQLVECGVANLSALIRRKRLAELGGWSGLLADLQASNRHAAQRLRGARPILEKPLAISSIPYGFVRKEALAPHLYAVGDQAAVIPSFTGDGMSIALYTGVSAANALLAATRSEAFQRELHAQLHSQVLRATALSFGFVHPASQTAISSIAHLWPGLIRFAAGSTRLSHAALGTALPPTFLRDTLALH